MTLLSRITTDPKRFQFRSQPYSRDTVEAMVSEGIDLAKFDPIPVIRQGGTYIVAGDGHSRLEAIHRLKAAKRLPPSWRRNGSWDIPTRPVSATDALRLAYIANMSRAPFTAVEEARIFQARLDAGETMEQIARTSHKSTVHVAKTLALNALCRDIAQMVEASPEAGGVDRLTGQVLANGFTRHGITPAQQRDLWHEGLKYAGLNFQSAKRFIDMIGKRMAARSAPGELLFQLPANAAAVIAEAKDRVAAYRRARTGIAMLVSAAADDGIDDYPELDGWIRAHGAEASEALGQRLTEDGEILAGFISVRKAG